MTRSAPPDRRYADDHLAELTDRQRRVLDLIVAGKTNAQIGEALGITLDGAKWNVSEILTRLGFSSREEAADYWRSRGRIRRQLTRPLRALVGAPLAVKAAGAAGAVAVAAIAVGIFALSSGGGEASKGSVAPFYMEAVVTQYVEPDDRAVGTVAAVGADRTIRSRQIIRWWHLDANHARFEREQVEPPLDANTFIMLFDGRLLAGYWSSDNSYAIEKPPPPSSASGFYWPGLTIVFGPSIEPTIAALLGRLSHWNEGPVATGPASGINMTPLPVPTPTPPGQYGPAVRVGETDLLGRRVVVLERSSAPYEQTVKMWVDPESMMVLRHESNVGRWVAEVTLIDTNPKFGGSLFSFSPPPGATDRKAASPATRPAGPQDRGRDTPSGLYESRGLPLGLQPGIVRSGADSGGITSFRTEFHREATPNDVVLTFEQRFNAGPLPKTLTGGEPLTVNGYRAYLTRSGKELRLAWSDGKLWLLVSTTELARDDLLQFAGALQQAP